MKKAIGKCKNNQISFSLKKYALNCFNFLSLGLQLIWVSAIIKQFLPHCSALSLQGFGFVLEKTLQKDCTCARYRQRNDTVLLLDQLICHLHHPSPAVTEQHKARWALEACPSWGSRNIQRSSSCQLNNIYTKENHEGGDLTPKISCRCYFTKL